MITRASSPARSKLIAVQSSSVLLSWFWAAVCSPALASEPAGAQWDASKLPLPSSQTVQFSRDIKPLLEDRCLRCHSGDKPKSGFRLTSREAALKGGSNGIDIVPGQSARSPLVFYVAQLVPDMEMPPSGRGASLSSNQVALIRAWIDQGLVWESKQEQPPPTAIAFSTTIGWTGLRGDRQKFRELFWQPGDLNGGIDNFELQHRPDPDTRILTSGHALRDDFALSLSAERNNLGFARFHFQQYRKYYDDTGGYDHSLNLGPFSLDRDLHLDIGKAAVEFGLTLPRLPKVSLGYEYDYKDGAKSTLQWGPVSSEGQIRDLYPAAKDISERVHILKFHLEDEIAGVSINDDFRAEWYRLTTQRLNDSSYQVDSGSFALTHAEERQSYFQGANALHLEKQVTDWFFAAGGYLYSRLTSEASVDVQTFNAAALEPIFAAPGWHAPEIELERESHVFSLSTLLGPWQGLSLSLGAQNEWTRQQGLGVADVDIALPFAPYLFPVDPERIHSDFDRALFTQTAGLRFTKIPFTTLFADGRFEQENLGQFEEEEGGLTPFLRQADITGRLWDFRAGFNTSPWKFLEFSAQYHSSDRETDYDNLRKEVMGLVYPGYPGFIQWRDVLSREPQARLSIAFSSRLKAALAYTWMDTTYRNQTEPLNDPISGATGGVSPGGRLQTGVYQAHTPSLSLTFTPWQRLALSASLIYQNARTVTASQGSPAISPYAGDILTFLGTGTFVLNHRTELFCAYSFSTADFSADHPQDGLPLGIEYHQHSLQAGLRRQLNANTSLGLQYRFYLYTEHSVAHANDFDAQAVFASLSWKLP